jgi:hypothetical protein
VSAVDFLSGLTVHQIRVGYDLRLIVSDAKWSSENDAEVVIESPCTVTYPDGSELRVRLVDRETLPALLSFQSHGITDASGEAGTLRVVLDNGSTLVIPALAECEAWRIEGPGEHGVVCMPGGELAIW